MSVGKPDKSFCPVATDCITDFFAGCYTESVVWSVVGHYVNNGVFRGDISAFFVECNEISVIFKNFCIKHNNTKAGRKKSPEEIRKTRVNKKDHKNIFLWSASSVS